MRGHGNKIALPGLCRFNDRFIGMIRYNIHTVTIHARPGGQANPAKQKRHSLALSFQSTPDPEVRRLVRRTPALRMNSRFQSTPDPEVRRIRREPGRRGPARRVSIHARPGGQANRSAQAGVSLCTKFQSTPDPEVRRINSVTAMSTGAISFQSTPDPEVRRIYQHGRHKNCRRRFNPRPTRRSGESVRHQREKRDSDVSIHARPGGQANHYGRISRSLYIFCFNPRPTRRSGESSLILTNSPSSPGFNPRPTRRSGESPLVSPMPALCIVFQSTPDPEVRRIG